MHEDTPRTLENLVNIYGESNVILAGGAVRDWYLDKPIRDYDFFIKGDPEKCGYTKEKLGDDEEYYENNSHILSVYNIPFAGRKVQFIFVDCPPREIIDTFDYNICKCYYSPKNERFVFTNKFKHDVENKTLTLNTISPATFGAGKKQKFHGRLERMRAKFSDYQLHTHYIDAPKKFKLPLPPWTGATF